MSTTSFDNNGKDLDVTWALQRLIADRQWHSEAPEETTTSRDGSIPWTEIDRVANEIRRSLVLLLNHGTEETVQGPILKLRVALGEREKWSTDGSGQCTVTKATRRLLAEYERLLLLRLGYLEAAIQNVEVRRVSSKAQEILVELNTDDDDEDEDEDDDLTDEEEEDADEEEEQSGDDGDEDEE